MLRRILIAALIAAPLALTGLGAPAHAKGPSSATIRGPGLDPLTLTWTCPHRDSLDRLVDASHYWGGPRRAWTSERPTGALGPMYQVLYRQGHSDEPYDQRLYPLAENGPVVYVPADQGSGLPSGWRSAPGLADALEQIGALESDEPELRPTAGEPVDATSEWSLLAVGAVGGALLASASRLVSGWRRRRA
jgi:hypothetical protein